MASGRKRRSISGATKARVALEAIREQRTIAQIAGQFECHPSMVGRWKKQAIQGLPTVFSNGSNDRSEEKLIASLYEQIGRLKMELEWIKKKSGGFS